MNYLAHFHIAQQTKSSIPGAFLGDFVKGKAWKNYPLFEQQGILLHRHIDSFIDQMVIKTGLQHCFRPKLRRYAGIALDVYFDHLLSQHWQDFSILNRSDFIQHCYQQLANFPLPAQAKLTAQRMQQYDWLHQYHHRASLGRTLEAISQRLRRPAPLVLMAHDLEQHATDIDAVCLDLYRQVLVQANHYLQST
ncbi:ACP phosphodiesterase [Agarivorans sp. Z349TD_8]|uniref:acyl carrier protein phosphodiesterase n=1 Tax=Agarivorans sp. Z349TD_8 TaxID=3421434 RepID=UPI003D7D701D